MFNRIKYFLGHLAKCHSCGEKIEDGDKVMGVDCGSWRSGLNHGIVRDQAFLYHRDCVHPEARPEVEDLEDQKRES